MKGTASGQGFAAHWACPGRHRRFSLFLEPRDEVPTVTRWGHHRVILRDVRTGTVWPAVSPTGWHKAASICAKMWFSNPRRTDSEMEPMLEATLDPLDANHRCGRYLAASQKCRIAASLHRTPQTFHRSFPPGKQTNKQTKHELKPQEARSTAIYAQPRPYLRIALEFGRLVRDILVSVSKLKA